MREERGSAMNMQRNAGLFQRAMNTSASGDGRATPHKGRPRSNFDIAARGMKARDENGRRHNGEHLTDRRTGLRHLTWHSTRRVHGLRSEAPMMRPTSTSPAAHGGGKVVPTIKQIPAGAMACRGDESTHVSSIIPADLPQCPIINFKT